MIEQFVAGVEGSALPWTADPVAGVVVLAVALLVNVTVLDVQYLAILMLVKTKTSTSVDLPAATAN